MFVCYYKCTCLSWISSVTDITCYCRDVLQSEDNSHICRNLFQTKYTNNQYKTHLFYYVFYLYISSKRFTIHIPMQYSERQNKFGPQFHLLFTVNVYKHAHTPLINKQKWRSLCPPLFKHIHPIWRNAQTPSHKTTQFTEPRQVAITPTTGCRHTDNTDRFLH